MLTAHLPFLNSKTVVLASQSPRRLEILGRLALRVTVDASKFDETLDKAQFASAGDYAQATALRKAQEASQPWDVIISADTVVDLSGRVLEKPGTEAEAVAMLRALSDAGEHRVHTGVALLFAGEAAARSAAGGAAAGPASAAAAADGIVTRCFTATTRVRFAPLSESVVLDYVRSGEPFDKAGGYGIQGAAGSFIEGIDGCFYNVMGLPLHRVAAEIAAQIEGR